MKIAILGTRGIPNHYGGFEQFAEYFSEFLLKNGHEVYVYSSHNHIYKEKTYKGVNIIHKYDPEKGIGTAGQFIYDLNCILDSRKRNYDIILQLGYTSSSIWHSLLPKNSYIVTNMDGLEWKRTKYSKPVRRILKFAERLAVKSSDFLVADSLGIQTYLYEKYKKNSEYIAYGAEVFTNADEEIIKQYNLTKHNYNVLIARLEPENSIEIILDGIVDSNNQQDLLVIGNHETKYGRYLKFKYKKHINIKFLGAIYNLNHLNNIRYFSNIYFHGHTVGGTNPSLLEAMASGALIVAHDNQFNRGVLAENAFYFLNSQTVSILVDTVKKQDNMHFVTNNINSINNQFTWNTINGKYLSLFKEILIRGKKGS
jgi:glycosyltransferase involved in cell wall biosynthesis